MVGQYVAPGTAGAADQRRRTRRADPARARRVLVLARQRTIDQDPAFALRMLVDIAIRALSPAVNDPTTAVQALDRIEALLVELAAAPPGPVARASTTTDAARASSRRPRWTDYLELALTEIRRYGAGSAQIVRRLHALYDHLLRGRRRARARRGSSSSAGCSTKRCWARSPTRRNARSSSSPTGSGSAAGPRSRPLARAARRPFAPPAPGPAGDRAPMSRPPGDIRLRSRAGQAASSRASGAVDGSRSTPRGRPGSESARRVGVDHATRAPRSAGPGRRGAGPPWGNLIGATAST